MRHGVEKMDAKKNNLICTAEKCKDCKYYSASHNIYSTGFCRYGFYFVEPGDHCIYDNLVGE